jgi:hypothetical protein
MIPEKDISYKIYKYSLEWNYLKVLVYVIIKGEMICAYLCYSTVAIQE